MNQQRRTNSELAEESRPTGTQSVLAPADQSALYQNGIFSSFDVRCFIVLSAFLLVSVSSPHSNEFPYNRLLAYFVSLPPFSTFPGHLPLPLIFDSCLRHSPIVQVAVQVTISIYAPKCSVCSVMCREVQSASKCLNRRL